MPRRCFKRGSRQLGVLAGMILSIALGQPASATDEIQVYNAGIAAVGQLTIQQHLNYVALGQKDPPFPGGLVSNHSLNGTPEFAYGVTDWWEVGLYLPFAVQDQKFISDAFKLRTLFVSPHAEQRDFFYGVNLEFSNTTPPFAQTRFTLEVRPIIGVRNADYEFIVNPIIDAGFGKLGRIGLCARRASGAQARPGYVPGCRILRGFWRDREHAEACRSATHPVSGYRFQARRPRCGLRRRLRIDVLVRSLGHQDHHRLRVSGSWKQFERRRAQRCRTRQSDVAHLHAISATLMNRRHGRAILASRLEEMKEIA